MSIKATTELQFEREKHTTGTGENMLQDVLTGRAEKARKMGQK